MGRLKEFTENSRREFIEVYCLEAADEFLQRTDKLGRL